MILETIDDLIPAIPELVEYHKKECNRYANGYCSTSRCLLRGGWKHGSKFGYEVATCEDHETILLLNKLKELSK